MADRRLDYCGVASLLGKRAANDLWDLTTLAGIDMDHISDQMAQEHRMNERAIQEARCSACKENCRG